MWSEWSRKCWIKHTHTHLYTSVYMNVWNSKIYEYIMCRIPDVTVYVNIYKCDQNGLGRAIWNTHTHTSIRQYILIFRIPQKLNIYICWTPDVIVYVNIYNYDENGLGSAVSNTHTHTSTRQYIRMCRIPQYMNISYVEFQTW